MALLLTVRRRRRDIRTVVFSSIRIFQPLRHAFDGPKLFPSIFTQRQLGALGRRVNGRIRYLIFNAQAFLDVELSRDRLAVVKLQGVFTRFERSTKRIRFIVRSASERYPFSIHFRT